MQFYDLLMLAIMGGAVLFGLWKGLAWQVASLAAIFVSYFVAINFRGELAGLIQAEPPWDRFLAMLILFIVTSLAIWILFGFVKRTIKQLHLKSFDRQIGGLLGAVKGVVLCIIVTLFAVTLLGDRTREAICTSKSGNYIAQALHRLEGVVPAEIGQYIDPYIDRFHDAMQEHQPESLQAGSQSGLVPTDGGAWPNSNGIQVGPLERVGQLHTSSGNQTSERQYTASGTWQPYSSPQNNVQPSGAQTPLIDWQRAAGAILDAATKMRPKNR